MKRKILLLGSLFIAFGLVFTACETEEEDACSAELGDVGYRWDCDVPVMPQICTVDGVDDHWVLDGVEYECKTVDGVPDCTDIPQDLVEAILAKDGCGTKKSLDLDAINAEISKEAKVILANLKMESVLCKN